MTDMGDVITTVQAYGDERVDVCDADAAKIESALRMELDAAAQREVDLMARIAELEAAQGPPADPTEFGVCIHSTFRTSTYGNDDAVFDAVIRSGATKVRDLLSTSAFQQKTQQPLWRRFRDAGIGVHATVGKFGKSTAADRPAMRAALLAVADCVTEVAGFNEPDGGIPRSAWLPSTVSHQRWLYETVQAEADLDHVAVCGPPLRDANRSLAEDLGVLYEQIRGAYDVANLHIYPGHAGDAVEDYINDRIDLVSASQVVISELGFSTRKGETPGPTAFTEAEQADLLARCITHAKADSVGLYVYELLDDPDPTGDEAQSNWGIVRTPALDPSTWTDKPALTALADLAQGA